MKKNKNDVSDMFEPTFRDGEPTFTWDWTIATIMLGFCLFFTGIIITLI